MNYKHALFLHPYLKDSSAGMGFFPPTGLEYVGTAVEGLVDRVTILDLRQEKKFHKVDNLIEFIRQDVDLLCVSVNWRYYFREVCELINHLPADRQLVVGGQRATEDVEELFKRCPHIDIIVRGEGEETIKDIVKGIARKDILGISYRNNGQVIHNPIRPLPPAENIRYPNRRLRRTSYQVMSKGIKLLNGGFDTVLSARGCPYNCKFCTFSLNPLGQKRKYSARSPESVIEELKTVDAEIVFFADDSFFIDSRRAERICELVIEEGIRKKFVAQARLDVARHPRMLEKALRAGFKALLIGIESTQDRILKQLNKGFTVKVIREYFEVLRRYPFYYHGYFIYGNIGESREEMLSIAPFARELGLDSVSTQKLRVDKFSPLKTLVEDTPGYHTSSGGFVYSDQYNMKELKSIGRRLKFSFYTPLQLYRTLRKIFLIGLITPRDLIRILILLPLLSYRFLMREIEKKLNRIRKKLTPPVRKGG